MVFSSSLFLFLFLPITLVLYYLTHLFAPRWQNAILLICSAAFYVWGAPKSTFLFLFFLSILIDYYLARYIEQVSKETNKKRLVIASVTINLGLLAYYKYANFFIHELNSILVSLQYQPIRWFEVILPIGISFFVFHKISYVIDVFRGKAKALRNVVDFSMYLLLFPQLIAGPIVRFHEIEDQLRARTVSVDLFYEGIWRFSLGLAKKVLVANTLGNVVDQVFKALPGDLAPTTAWIGAVLYAFQIYFDFSGYSDMAIGLGNMFGFRLPENFNRPYVATSITEFWRRWHMSLSRFFKDYLYIPLGGNRCAKWRNYLNLWIVFGLCGLWHGASWGFIVWGLYHGLLLTLDKLFLFRLLKRTPNFVSGGITFVLVVIGWVFFRAENLAYALMYLKVMFSLGNDFNTYSFIQSLFNNKIIFYLCVALVFGFLDFSKPRLYHIGSQFSGLKGSLALFLLFYCCTVLSTGSFNPFIYFQF